MTIQPTTVQIHLPALLRRHAGMASVLTASGITAGEALEDLVRQHTALRAQLYDEHGALRHFVTVFRNDEDIRYLEAERTPLREGDILSVVPSLAGG